MNRQKEYLLTRVRSASPMELVSILYETAIQSTEDALANLCAGDILKRGEAVNKAVETIFDSIAPCGTTSSPSIPGIWPVCMSTCSAV